MNREWKRMKQYRNGLFEHIRRGLPISQFTPIPKQKLDRNVGK